LGGDVEAWPVPTKATVAAAESRLAFLYDERAVTRCVLVANARNKNSERVLLRLRERNMTRALILAGFVLASASALAQQDEATCPVPGADEFSVVLIPDTQYYPETTANGAPDVYRLQTQWIVANKEKYKIRFVAHLGDVTDNYENTSDGEWKRTRDAHRLLDEARIPYSVIPGNHDYKRRSNSDKSLVRNSLGKFNQYYGPPNELGYDNGWQYSDVMGPGYENNYSTFEVSGRKFLMLGLEFTPRKDTVCWASDVLKQHQDHWAIVSTHCYLNRSGYDPNCDASEKYRLTGAAGGNLFNELVGRHPNVALVVNGHIAGSEHRCNRRACWRPVHEILTDYQYEPITVGGRSFPKHGAGWMRILKIRPGQSGLSSCVLTVLDGLGVNKFKYQTDSGNMVYDDLPTEPSHKYTLPFFDVSQPPPAYSPAPIHFFSDRAVNAVDAGEQTAPSVATNSSGDWVAVWADSPGGVSGSFRVKARVFKSDGCGQTNEFSVSPSASLGKEVHPVLIGAVNAVSEITKVSLTKYISALGKLIAPAVAMNNSRFAVAWAEDTNADGNSVIKVRVFSLDGTHLWTRTASSTTQRPRGSPKIGMDTSGGIVVVWHDEGGQPNGLMQIYGRGYNANGSSRFSVKALNATATGDQRAPALAVAADGDFVVAWQDDTNENKVYQVKARGFTANGAVRVGQHTVNAVSSGQQVLPAIAMDAQKRYVVTWQDDSNDNRVYQIKLRGFSATNGQERISQRTVNTDSSGQQLSPQIAMAPSGAFAVTWADDRNDNGIYQIRTRRYAASGSARTPKEETVNRVKHGQQSVPSIAMNSSKHIIAWRDDMEENQLGEILATGCLNGVGCEREERILGHRQALLEAIKSSCSAGRWPKCSLGDINVLPDVNLLRQPPDRIHPVPH
jgi:hypothetical protein